MSKASELEREVEELSSELEWAMEHQEVLYAEELQGELDKASYELDREYLRMGL